MNGRLGMWLLAAAGWIIGISLPAAPARGCPGCQPSGLTFSDEMAEMDVVVIGRLIEMARRPDSKESASGLPTAKFEVTRVLKGDSRSRVGDKLETPLAGDAKAGSQFLIMGIRQPNTLWSTPIEISTRGAEYLAQLLKFPPEGVARYKFVLDYLEDDEVVISRDAYDELAKAPYSDVRALKDHLRRDEIIARINDVEIPTTRRRLYFVMLGIVGGERDIALLEEMMQAADRQQRRGLDMLIFSYLALRGAEGLPDIEKRFLANADCDFSDTYAAIMALRFHAAEGVTLTKQQAAASLRAVLDRPQVADLVIPDLARWEDWSAMDKMFELYKNADEKSTWVRVPVINYLRACPLPRAKELIAECEKIDPQSVKRAHAFFPSVSAPPAAEQSTKKAPLSSNQKFVSTSAEAVPAAFAAPIPEPDEAGGPTVDPARVSGLKADSPRATVASLNPGVAPAKALKTAATTRPNLGLLFGVPILVGAGLWVLQSSILRGRIGRG